MSIERWINGHLELGNAEAAMDGRVLLDRHGEIPLPNSETSENLVTKPFTVQEKRALIKDGHVIYPFVRQTLEGQIAEGKPFRHVADAGDAFKTTPSMFGEVAFLPDPNRFFIPGSNNATFEQQKEMIERYGDELRVKLDLPGHVRAVMGEAPDYAQLAFIHLKETNTHLFGEDYGYNYARTVTPTFGLYVAEVGRFSVTDGLRVGQGDREYGSGRVFASPLVISWGIQTLPKL